MKREDFVLTLQLALIGGLIYAAFKLYGSVSDTARSACESLGFCRPQLDPGVAAHDVVVGANAGADIGLSGGKLLQQQQSAPSDADLQANVVSGIMAGAGIGAT